MAYLLFYQFLVLIQEKAYADVRGRHGRQVNFRGDKKKGLSAIKANQPGQVFARPHWYIRDLTELRASKK